MSVKTVMKTTISHNIFELKISDKDDNPYNESKYLTNNEKAFLIKDIDDVNE